MRPLVTWLLVGARLVIGLFAARDALQSEGTAAEPVAPTGTFKRVAQAPAGPPAIPGRVALAAELKELGAHGALYVTDSSCRRFVLRLPALTWTTSRELPVSDCGLWAHQPSDADSGLAARQVNADTIEVTSGGWSFGFEGISPAFKPAGILTFVRDGRLREWTGRCPEAARNVVFEGLHDVARCDRPVAGAPRDVREVAWLSVRDYAVVAGPDGATSLEVVRGGQDGAPLQLGRRADGRSRGEPERSLRRRPAGRGLDALSHGCFSSAPPAARQRRARPLDHVVARRAPRRARDADVGRRFPQ